MFALEETIMPTFDFTIFLLGCVGGLLPDAIRFVKDRYNKKIADYLSFPQFWGGLALLVLLGGFTAWVLGAKDWLVALGYGFIAPELLSAILSKQPGGTTLPVPSKGGKTFNLRAWWAR
jgi:hypothetical protein